MALPKKTKPLTYDMASSWFTNMEQKVISETNKFVIAIKEDGLERIVGPKKYDYPDFISNAIALEEALYEMDEKKIRIIARATLEIVKQYYPNAESTKKTLKSLAEIQLG